MNMVLSWDLTPQKQIYIDLEESTAREVFWKFWEEKVKKKDGVVWKGLK